MLIYTFSMFAKTGIMSIACAAIVMLSVLKITIGPYLAHSFKFTKQILRPIKNEDLSAKLYSIVSIVFKLLYIEFMLDIGILSWMLFDKFFTYFF